jgi:hypothetical protein
MDPSTKIFTVLRNFRFDETIFPFMNKTCEMSEDIFDFDVSEGLINPTDIRQPTAVTEPSGQRVEEYIKGRCNFTNYILQDICLVNQMVCKITFLWG